MITSFKDNGRSEWLFQGRYGHRARGSLQVSLCTFLNHVDSLTKDLHFKSIFSDVIIPTKK